MSAPGSRLDRALRSMGERPAPPPSTALESMLADVKPVRLRRPARALGAVLAGSLAVLGVRLALAGMRHDLAALPAWWFWATAAAWLAAFVVPLAISLVPRRGSMFVSTPAARGAAIAFPALGLVMALLLRIDAPPATVMPATMPYALDRIAACLAAGLALSVAPLVLGVLALRRAPRPLHDRWIGAALGAASGALAALMLHAHCWIGGALHAGVAHAGQAVLGAMLGALLVPWLTASRRAPPGR